MAKCIQCEHWNMKKAGSAMAKLGFAPCDAIKQHGSNSGTYDRQCDKFNRIDDERIKSRERYLQKTE